MVFTRPDLLLYLVFTNRSSMHLAARNATKLHSTRIQFMLI